MRRALARLMAEETFEPFVFVMNSGDRYEVRDFHAAVRDGDDMLSFTAGDQIVVISCEWLKSQSWNSSTPTN